MSRLLLLLTFIFTTKDLKLVHAENGKVEVKVNFALDYAMVAQKES
jgi:hypothetical protein